MFAVWLLLLQGPGPQDKVATPEGPVTVWFRYGLHDKRKKVMRRSAYFNVTRPGYEPRPGHTVRLVKKNMAYTSPTKKTQIRVGLADLNAEMVVNRVLEAKRARGVLGYKGHELWIEVTIPAAMLAEPPPEEEESDENLATDSTEG